VEKHIHESSPIYTSTAAALVGICENPWKTYPLIDTNIAAALVGICGNPWLQAQGVLFGFCQKRTHFPFLLLTYEYQSHLPFTIFWAAH